MSEARTGWFARLFGNRRPKSADASPAPPELPRTLTMSRVGDHLTRRGYHFRVDDDGDITGTWDGHRFWFLLLGDRSEVLQVRGRWSTTLPVDARLATLQAVNDWNRERIWPKVYVREEAGRLAVYAEVSVDFERGVTDAQLAQTVSCGLGTAVQLFHAVGATLPPGVVDDAG
ncbi:YbjN domain-containing protein [Cellulosimicrobium marinum]|uniref:YbjN domain-containing protein n=1 Tax=Cellulosimicrobium marinum TaxID=1638992 RepID=UPI001E635CB2|nr:YbjN domain-containing protein [Cellulosimicrobium marinum]MCB7137748.1 YbjN domain-containing protein [Cellulosimicrobium marinum]